MEQNRNELNEEKRVGITNRGIEQENPGQDFVMDTVDGMEIDGRRDDLNTGDRLPGSDFRTARNLEPETDGGLTADEESGGERRIDSKDGTSDHSHH